jgi:arginine deiminase
MRRSKEHTEERGKSYVEELSQSSGTQDPRVASCVGVATVATVKDAWVASRGVVDVDLREREVVR